MNKFNVKTTILVITSLIIGAIVGILGWKSLINLNEMGGNNAQQDEPLYWVAPMDANFRRDKPGLSPMGMALVPVYESMDNNDAGVVVISPEVVNNLGVKIAPVLLGNLNQTIRTTGIVTFDEDSRINIHSRVEGWIEKTHVKTLGDWVKKGQPLYDIYSPELVNAQEEFVLAMTQNNNRLIQAAIGRLESLLVPQLVIERIKQTRKVSNTLTINAPVSGVIDNIAIGEGAFIKPIMNLLTISSLDTVWINVDVFESQAQAINLGDNALITSAAYPNKEWRSNVDVIYPVLNEKTRTLQFKLRVNNPEHQLKPNMYTNILLQSTPKPETLLIPNEAVIKTGHNNRVVLALGDGKFKSIKVDIGLSNQSLTQILSGLESGDNVVTSAQFLLDSESNITSDLMRYSDAENREKIWTKATVNQVYEAHSLVNVSHEAIPAWNWPEMTMEFYVDQSISMTEFEAAQTIDIEIMQDNDGDYVITAIKAPLKNVNNMPETMTEQNHD